MKHSKLFSLILLTLFATSCNQNDEATGLGDALIVAKRSGTTTVYGLALYAYTYSTFSSVKAVNSSEKDTTYSLVENGSKTTFYYETPESELSTTKPAAGTFTFSAVFENGVTQDFQDVLSSETVAPVTFEECAYSSANKKLDISWTLLSNADCYAIYIYDGTSLVYATSSLDNTTKTRSITESDSGWASGYPVSGKTYTVKIYAFVYEDAVNNYNIQATSISEKTVVWGS